MSCRMPIPLNSELFFSHICSLKVKGKVNFILEGPWRPRGGGDRYIPTLYLTSLLGGQRYAPAVYPRGRNPVPILQEAGWDSRPVTTGAENLATLWDSISNPPARTESLYRVRNPMLWPFRIR
jgi:hypothetical protein